MGNIRQYHNGQPVNTGGGGMTEIPWSTWETMSEEARAAIEDCIVTDCPDSYDVGELKNEIEQLNQSLAPIILYSEDRTILKKVRDAYFLQMIDSRAVNVKHCISMTGYNGILQILVMNSQGKYFNGMANKNNVYYLDSDGTYREITDDLSNSFYLYGTLSWL